MDRHLAIRNTHKNVGVINGKSDAWDLEGNKITVNEDLVAKEMAKLQAEYNANQYQRDRLAEYPSIQELVVALYDADDKAEIDKKRSEIKKKYPKPE